MTAEDTKQLSFWSTGDQLAQDTREAGQPASGGAAPRPNPAEPKAACEPGRPDRPWLGRRRLIATYAVFAAYAVLFAVFSRGEDQVWAIWASCGYAAALFIMWRWPARTAAVLVSVAVAVIAPLLWLSFADPLETGMMVIDRSATLLLHHGSPYLSSRQVTCWQSYDPYLTVMTLFGMPSAIGLGGLAGNSGVWIAVVTVALLAAAFRVAVPRRRCALCRRDALLATAVAIASPMIGLNLAVITTDPPVLALILLSMAFAARPPTTLPAPGSLLGSGIALGVACDLKSTAWLAVPVMAAMFVRRDGARAAVRFAAASLATTVVLIVALAPAVLVRPAVFTALVENSVLFPLGLTRYKTPAESLLPGHLLTELGAAGHVLSVGLLLAAGLAIAISLVIRPPRDVPAAARRLALGLTLMFLLGPAVRFGYFIYPLGLLGWPALTCTTPGYFPASSGSNRTDSAAPSAGAASSENDIA